MANTESFLLELAFNVFVSLHKRSSAPQRKPRAALSGLHTALLLSDRQSIWKRNA